MSGDIDDRPRLRLNVLVAQSSRYSRLSDDEISIVLDAAEATFADRFGTPITLTWEHGADLEDWYIDKSPEAAEWGEPLRQLASSDTFCERWMSNTTEFLRQWNIHDLSSFSDVADLSSSPRDYRQIAGILLSTWQRKVRGYTKPVYGFSAVDLGHAWQHSHTFWSQFLFSQDVDVVLTNVLTILDDPRKPYPHSIFKMAKVNGFAYGIYMGDGVQRHSIFASAFDALSDDSSFIDDYGHRSRRDRLKIFGEVTVAHELGHAMYGLADYYSGHDSSCLMTTPPHALRNIDFHDALSASGGVCSRCQPYTVALNLAILGGQQRMAGDFTSAIRNLRRSRGLMPRNIGYARNRLKWIDDNIRLCRRRNTRPTSDMLQEIRGY